MTEIDEEHPSQPTKKRRQPQSCRHGVVSRPADAVTASALDGGDEALVETLPEVAQEYPSLGTNPCVSEDSNPDEVSGNKEKVCTTSMGVGVPVENPMEDASASILSADPKGSVDKTGAKTDQDCPVDKKDIAKRFGRSCGVLRGLEAGEAKLIQKQPDGLNPASDDAPEDERIDIIASIQPLPLSRNSGFVTAEAMPGAFAISSAHSLGPSPRHEFAFRAEGVPPPSDDVRLEVTDIGISGTTNELVEAHLVEEDEYVVAAEKLNSCGISKRTSIICWGQFFLIIALVVTFSAVMIPKKSTTKSDSLDVIDMADGTSGDTYPCMKSTEELWYAIDAYQQDNSPSTNVSQHYGWPIGQWCVSNVSVFFKAFHPGRSGFSEASTYFHDDIGSWDISNARELEQTFRGCRNVSASWGIQNWDTGSITNVQELFMATSWTDPALELSRWNTSSMWNMGQLFRKSDVAKANISSWDTRNVRSLSQFACEAPNFNDDLSNWDVSNVQTLNQAFRDTAYFNFDLSRWNTRSLIDLQAAFNGAASFNQDLSQWEVKNVKKMMQVFARSGFNQDISGWNVSSVEEVRWAFSQSSFNQNLCAWGSKLSPHLNTTGMFRNTPCPNTSDPVIPGGPFCYNCNE